MGRYGANFTPIKGFTREWPDVDGSAGVTGGVAVAPVKEGRPPPMDPILLSVPDAAAVSGMSRTRLYVCLKAGDIRAVKNGGRTFVVVESLRAYLAGLPAWTGEVEA